MKTLRPLILLASILILNACSENEEVNNIPSLVQESVGTYTYTGTIFTGTNNSEDINGTMSLSTNGDDIIITVDGDEMFQVSRVVFAQSNLRYGFDIIPTTYTDDNDNVIDRYGWGDMIMEHQPYDGLYVDDLGFLYITFINSDPQTSEPISGVYIKGVRD